MEAAVPRSATTKPAEGAQAGRRLNLRLLRRGARREAAGYLSLSLPAAALVIALLVVPMAWLFWTSALDMAGNLSLENYERMLQPVYRRAFFTTFRVAFVVSVACALMAYPMAYLMAQSGRRLSLVLLLAVMLPFWTSVLVRTYAWLVLLQRTGLINSWLIGAGVIDTPLALVHNELGVIIGMVHVMLPFMILPLYASMKAIDPALLLAAANCGATPAQGFRQVYFPQTISGLGSGISLVFVLCLGFFVTPVLLGGGRTNMWAQQISDNISLYGNWGAASSLGVVLVVSTALILGGMHLSLRWFAARAR